jgi:hypothetical protein
VVWRAFYLSPAAGFTAGLNYINVAGQSLAEGSKDGAVLTTAQEFNNVQYPKFAVSPSAYEPAIAPGVDLESPMYGAQYMVKQLIAAENPGAPAYQMLGCNNGQGARSILTLGKGSDVFDNALSQVASTLTIAAAEARTARFQATMWLQGEADNAMSRADYLSVFRKMVNDYDDMGRQAMSTRDGPVCITYQTTTNASPNVALAQLDAAIADPLVYMASPLYPLDFANDKYHLNPTGAKVMGAYMGLVYKRVLIDGQNWSPVRILSALKSGNDVDLTFHVPSGSLAFDTATVPAQPNGGFSATDSGGTPITVTSATITGANTVRVTTASPVPSGGFIKYAQQAQVGGKSLGGSGNLRDTQGNSIVLAANGINWPMHNWVPLQEVQV